MVVETRDQPSVPFFHTAIRPPQPDTVPNAAGVGSWRFAFGSFRSVSISVISGEVLVFRSRAITGDHGDSFIFPSYLERLALAGDCWPTPWLSLTGASAIDRI
jgi:hypothetical protein